MSPFRAWALAAGCPAWLLEPIPVAGAVASCFLAIWLIVALLMFTSSETAQMVKDVKETVITEGSNAMNRAAETAKRGLSGDGGAPAVEGPRRDRPVALPPQPAKPKPVAPPPESDTADF